MTRDDLDVAVEWAAREGWNPGLSDADAFWAADPNGYFVARADDEVVGVVSCVRYGPSFAFAGFYIVAPDERGHGIGHLLAERVFSRAGDRVLGLDGVPEQQATYLSMGFRLVHGNVRFGGVVGDAPVSREVITLGPPNVDEIEDYDRSCFPGPRREFLEAWTGMPGALTLGVRDDHGLAGYGVIRPCRVGFKIGPLFADDTETADRLFDALAAHAGSGSEVFIDVPEPNEAALALAEERGLDPVFETARMYRHGTPEIRHDRVFGVTSFELG
jgi:GNAT superfamily N-acetyltransferase